MVNYEFIGARIREARLRKKLSQEQLAAMVDVGTSHISHLPAFPAEAYHR